ncbi:tRNA (guanine-N1)-methyltransferase [Tenacibaculum crassostreae]|uniref:tRNA (guanine-N1)-methyltransferase n=1 Tax=Tenacibaculum crassostreae TaxID=502683 RepID=UPI0038943003
MKFLKIVFIFIFTQNVVAQTQLSKTEVEALPNTIENQFLKTYRLSNNWQEYKMIKRTTFLSFQKNVLDSVTVLKKDAQTKQLKINEQQKSIDELQAKIDTLNTDLTTSIGKEDAISFVGIPLNKSTYNTIVWGIIFALLAGLAFFIYRFNNSNVVTKETKSLLTETEEEFEQYKRNSIEKEQKLRRQLQDEINKQRGVN